MPELHDMLKQLGQRMMIDYITKGLKITATPQDGSKVSYAPKITRDDGRIDFTRDDALTLTRKMRAFTGWPNLWFNHQKSGSDSTGDSTAETVRLIVHEAVICESAPNVAAGTPDMPAGTVISLDNGIKVQCIGGTAINITKIQKIGGKILSWRDFLNGYPIICGNNLIF